MVLIHGQGPPESPPAAAPLPSPWAASTLRPSSSLSAVRSAPALGSARPLVSGNHVVWRGGEAPSMTNKGGRTEVSYLHDHRAEFASIADIVAARRKERPFTAAATLGGHARSARALQLRAHAGAAGVA